MRILAISGSLRAGSYNRGLLEAARRRAAERGGAEVELLDPELIRALPHFDEDLEADPGPAVAALRERIAAADAVLVATPEYNSSIPGALKNALDWASRPKREAALRNKPAAVIGASTGRFGAVWAQAETRKILGSSGARVLDDELAVPQAHLAPAGAGGLPREQLEAFDELVEALVASVREREPALVA
jgi:chromate reductase, NAD(P)H dehydrogenase (quinone)